MLHFSQVFTGFTDFNLETFLLNYFRVIRLINSHLMINMCLSTPAYPTTAAEKNNSKMSIRKRAKKI